MSGYLTPGDAGSDGHARTLEGSAGKGSALMAAQVIKQVEMLETATC